MKTLRYLAVVMAVLVCGNLLAQESQKDLEQISREHGEYFFSLNINETAEIQTLTNLCSVDKFDGQHTLVCYANQEEYDNLQRLGYQPTLMMPPSMVEKFAMWDGTDRAHYDWDSYPTYEAYEAMVYQFATDHPDKCEILTLGTLPSGRKILVAHLNNGSDYGKPKFLYTSTIHGDETTGWIMMLRLIDYLLENPDLPEVQMVMDNLDLFIGPNANPDGTYHGGNNTVYGARRNNANDVDMNRNYADPHGSPHPDGNEYQSETQWFMQLAEDYPFVMGANYHGGSEVFNYPWDNTYTYHADDDWYQLVGHEYADLCHTHSTSYMSGFNDGIVNGARWYMIAGGRQDYMNGYHECREVTIECSTPYTPNPSQLPTYWTYNKEAIFAYMNQCLYGIHGTVTDSYCGQPLAATITIASHDDQYSTVSSHLPAGDYHRPIKGGTYDVTYSCDGYQPQTITVTVADYETVVQDVALVPITPAPVVVEAFAAPQTIQEGHSTQLSAVATGGDCNFTYYWEPTETLDDPTSATPVATPVDPETTYKVTVTDGFGTIESAEVTVNISNWTVTEDCCAPFVYPNPNNGTFTLNVTGDFEYTLFNSLGQQVLSGQANGKTQIDGSHLNQGIYFLHLKQQGTSVEKLVIEK